LRPQPVVPTEFLKLTGNPHPRPYERHEKLIPKFENLWEVTKDVDKFIEESWPLLEN